MEFLLNFIVSIAGGGLDAMRDPNIEAQRTQARVEQCVALSTAERHDRYCRVISGGQSAVFQKCIVVEPCQDGGGSYRVWLHDTYD